MAHIITIVDASKCTVLDHGRLTVWQWSLSTFPGYVTLWRLWRGKETRYYKVVEKIAEKQYRMTLEASQTTDTHVTHYGDVR